MVFVNEKKFACEACIKGHRSSSCHHTERPLFEVKKKGRPVSQCFKCRELRQERHVHSKCTCTPRRPVVDKVPIPAARPDKKPRRFMPSVPTLPNGISDALQPLSASSPPDFRRTVHSLLNPCHCKSIRQCTCRKTPCIAGPSSGDIVEDYGLQTLAEAAMLFRDPLVQDSSSEHSMDPPPRSCCVGKRAVVSPHAVPPAYLDLPPILVGPIPSTSAPDFPTMPPLSSIESIAGSGCTCGLHCICPGCIEHRTPRYVDVSHKDCSEGCGHCVDRTAGIELPGLEISTLGESIVDAFFARATALPDPPANRRTNMETGNVTIYPCDSLSGRSTGEAEERGVVLASSKDA